MIMSGYHKQLNASSWFGDWLDIWIVNKSDESKEILYSYAEQESKREKEKEKTYKLIFEDKRAYLQTGAEKTSKGK